MRSLRRRHDNTRSRTEKRTTTAAWALALLLLTAAFTTACESMSVHAEGCFQKGNLVRVKGEIHAGQAPELEITEPAGLTFDVTFTGANGEQVGGSQTLTVPFRIDIPNGATTMHGTPPGSGAPGSQVTQPLWMNDALLGSARRTGRWAFGWPLEDEGVYYYADINPFAPIGNIVQAIMPYVQAGPNANTPAWLDFGLYIRSTVEQDDSLTVVVSERSPFTEFGMAFNGNEDYAGLDFNSFLTQGNGWYSVAVNVPVSDYYTGGGDRLVNGGMMGWRNAAEPNEHDMLSQTSIRVLLP